jgi:hypothetical protein
LSDFSLNLIRKLKKKLYYLSKNINSFNNYSDFNIYNNIYPFRHVNILALPIVQKRIRIKRLKTISLSC